MKNTKKQMIDLKKFLKKYKRNDKSLPLGKLMYKTFKKESKKRDVDCGHLLLEWANDHFWRLMLKDNMVLFHELYEALKKGKYTQRNPYIYGDIDKYLWLEKTGDGLQVIVQQTRNSMADNYTHLFIYRNPVKNSDLDSFKIATAWQREKKTKLGGGLTYLDQPSLKTYRDTNYKLTYDDCRDPGHVLSCELRLDKIERQYDSRLIKHALWLLRWCHKELVKK